MKNGKEQEETRTKLIQNLVLALQYPLRYNDHKPHLTVFFRRNFPFYPIRLQIATRMIGEMEKCERTQQRKLTPTKEKKR